MNKLDMTQLIEFAETLNILYVEDNKDSRIQTLKMLDRFLVQI